MPCKKSHVSQIWDTRREYDESKLSAEYALMEKWLLASHYLTVQPALTLDDLMLL